MLEAGYDPARLPPGQYLTEKWPVLHAGSVARYDDLATWTPARLRRGGGGDRAHLGAVHASCPAARTCRTSTASRAGRSSTTSFEGVHWRELAKLARPKPTARFAIAHAEAGFTANVPLSYIEDENALLATHGDGEPSSRPTTAIRCGSSCPASTSGRAPSGCAGSSSRRSTSPASGSATATRTTPTPGPSSATPSSENPSFGGSAAATPVDIWANDPPNPRQRAAAQRLFVVLGRPSERRRAASRPPFVRS